ncbi:MAG TPA: vitamin K epoxide reductase family protein [Candidatus Paceibacterota bacterium]|nr:vitamin K epoxide reductase family protein [Candidatus Paceibacterota bacterium]
METKPLLAPFYLIAASLVGVADTLYLSYNHYLNLIPSCSIGGCEVVLTSPYATPWGIVSLSYLGLVFYLFMLCLMAFLAYDPRSKGLRLAALLYTGFGLACSIFFELFQFFVIHALCIYCGLSAATTLALFGLALWHFIKTKEN